MKDEGFEYLLSILPPGPDKSCALHLFPRALDFVRERDSEFGTAQMQKHLKNRIRHDGEDFRRTRCFMRYRGSRRKADKIQKTCLQRFN